jgi:hypothetical protein
MSNTHAAQESNPTGRSAIQVFARGENTTKSDVAFPADSDNAQQSGAIVVKICE